MEEGRKEEDLYPASGQLPKRPEMGGRRSGGSSFPGRPRGVDPGRRARVDVAIGRFARLAFRSRIDPAAMGSCGRLDVRAVQDLDLVVTVKDDARVRPLGHHEFHVHLHILIGLLRNKAVGTARLAVEQDSGSRLAYKQSVLIRVERGVAGLVPFVGVVPYVEPVICLSHRGMAGQ